MEISVVNVYGDCPLLTSDGRWDESLRYHLEVGNHHVAWQVHSRLLHCVAKSSRRAPTWTLSMLSGWGSWRSCPSLIALCWVRSMAGDSAGTCMKELVLKYGSLNKRSNTEVLDWFFLVEEVVFVLVLLLSLGFWMKVTDEPTILSACRMVRTLFCRT